MIGKGQIWILLCGALLAGCVAQPVGWTAALVALAGANRPAMAWDERPEAAEWTAATLTALARQDDVLAAQVPGDVARFCPGYQEAGMRDRRAFWAGLLSVMAKHESGLNPQARGAGGRYVGLMQISPRTAAYHGCEATTGEALEDGAANLACAVTIAAAQVGRDGLIAGAGNRGLARDWGPMKREAKRAEIAAWTAAQDYCG